MRIDAAKGVMMRLGATITCGDCGKSEFFEGDLSASIAASQESNRWFLNERKFFVCGCKGRELENALVANNG